MRNQYLSRADVKEYLMRYPDVTKEEKKELLIWLKMGYSPYDNDRYIFNEFDRPTDFIDALRVEEAHYEEMRREYFAKTHSPCDVPLSSANLGV